MMESTIHFYFNSQQYCNHFLSKLSALVVVNVETLDHILKHFLGGRADMKTSDTEQNSSSTNSVSLSLTRTAIISYFERTAESCSGLTPDRRLIHFPFSQKHPLLDSSVKYYVRLNGDDPPSESYFVRICRNHCNCIEVIKTYQFSSCAVCDKLDRALQTATDSLQYTWDLSTCEMNASRK